LLNFLHGASFLLAGAFACWIYNEMLSSQYASWTMQAAIAEIIVLPNAETRMIGMPNPNTTAKDVRIALLHFPWLRVSLFCA